MLCNLSILSVIAKVISILLNSQVVVERGNEVVEMKKDVSPTLTIVQLSRQIEMPEVQITHCNKN